MSRRRYDPTIVLPPALARRLAAIAAAEHVTLRALVVLAARECARAYPDRFRAGKRLWRPADDQRLRAIYPHTSTATVAQQVRRTVRATYNRAKTLGLHKSAAYLAGHRRAGGDRLRTAGVRSRFQRGQVPANKGLRRPGYSVGRGRMQATQFKKGVRQGAAAANWRPIGTVAIDHEGYQRIKVREARPGEAHGFGNTRVWPLLNRHIWSQAHGPIPRGHAVVFKDGNRAHCALENLELITRRDLMRRNSVHTLPKPVAQAVQLLGALNRQIRRRTRDAEHDRRSA